MKTRNLVSSIVVLFLFYSNNSFSQAAIGADCNGLIDKQKINYRQVNINKWDEIHTSSCTSKKLKSAASLKYGIKTIVESIPTEFNLGIGKSKESAEKFCDEYDEFRSSITESIDFNQSLTDGQTEAFVKCVELTTDKNAAKIIPTISDSLITITIQRGILNTDFVSIDYPAYMACKSVNPKSGKKVEANKLSGTEIKTAEVMAIDCRRKQIKDGSITYYEGGVISVSTTTGALQFPVLREDSYLPAKVEENLKLIAAVEKDNARLLTDNASLKSRTVLICNNRDKCKSKIAGDFFADNFNAAFLTHAIATDIDAHGAEKDKNGKKICESIGMKFAGATARSVRVGCGGTFHLKTFNNTPGINKWVLTSHSCAVSRNMLDQVSCKL